MRLNTISSFVIVILIFLINACNKQKTEWQGTIEVVDGVTLVKNPKEPMYGKLIFELEKDLSIGNEEDDNYLFYRVVDIAVDQDANIYVLEYKNCRIQKFDKDGNYVQTIGRQGQGPGEFERPTLIFYDENTGNICVRDNRELVIFDRNGDYLNGIFCLIFPLDYMFSNDGNIWGKFGKTGEQYTLYSISMVNQQGEWIKDIAEYPIINSSFVSRGFNIMATHGYEYELVFSGLDSQSFIYGYSKEYKLHVVRIDGELLFIIEKDEPQIPFNNSLKNRIFDKKYKNLPRSQRNGFNFPDTLPYFNSIFTDDVGRIYVKKIQSPLGEDDFIECDIFSKDGSYLYKTKFTKQPQIIKQGYYYIIDVDEETGLETVKRFKIKNWEQIKN